MTGMAATQASAVTVTTTLNLYVSPTGGVGSCTSSTAPCSIPAAAAAARAVDKSANRVVVNVADGTYRMPDQLALTAADSGAAGNPVVWRAANGAHPLWEGTSQVTGWQATGTKNIYQATVPRGLTPRLITVNGVRAVEARGFQCTSCAITASGISGLPAQVASLTGSSMQVAIRARWRNFHCGIASVSGTTATMQEPCWGNAFQNTETGWQNAAPSANDGNGVDYIENSYDLLGTPGQYFMDSAKGLLYYVPRGNEDLTTADVELPTLEHLLTLTGTLDAPVHDIAFSGITFAGTTWNEPYGPGGYVGGQSGYHIVGTQTSTIAGSTESSAYERTISAVTVSAGKDIVFSGNTFQNLGAAAVSLEGGTTQSSLNGNLFQDLAAGGVQVGDNIHAPTDPRAKASNNYVVNNTVTRDGREFADAVGITGYYNNGLVIRHNTVTDVTYSGISVGWGWGFVGSAPTQSNIHVDQNKISKFMQSIYDGGAIYTQASSPGSTIFANYIDFSQTHNSPGIYEDEASAFYTATNNVVRGIDHVHENKNVSSTEQWIANWATYENHDLTIQYNWTDDNINNYYSLSPNSIYTPNSINVTAWPAAALAVQAQAGADPRITGASLLFADSQETTGENGAAVNAVDGNPATFWHTEWYNAAPGFPHEIQLDLGAEYAVDGFRYLPRQDGGVNGRVGSYEVYVSDSATSWGTPVSTGTFADTADEKTLSFPSARGRYLRLRVLTEAGNRGPWTSAAEISATGLPIAGSGNDFWISTPPGNTSVNPGNAITTTLTAVQTAGTAQPVTLSATGLPAEATASFSPSPVTPGSSTNLTIKTTPTTASGTYPITVTATQGSVSHAVTYNLTVVGTGTGTIVGVGSKRCVTVPAAPQMQLSDCVGGQAQTWTLASDGTIRAMGQCLTSQNGSSASVTPVQLAACGGSAQQWTYEPSTLAFTLLGQCLDAYGGGTGNGTPLILYPCTQNSNQQWRPSV
ncbi:discoidin domain-containing protein [Catenulispora subtropica]|uniref:F5/8 type C domain-containing protein n=1 Tax=Catenulispora subtropica TaxID=450798 RepID=A0ABN2QWZ8_9ACTN